MSNKQGAPDSRLSAFVGKRLASLLRRVVVVAYSGGRPSQVNPEARSEGEDEDDSPVDVGSFDVLRVLGKGSFAKVYLVRRRETGRTYAMKVLERATVLKTQQLQHTLTECHILRDVRHPFMVGLHWALQTEQHLLLVMDYMPGGELFFHLKRDRRFSEERARLYAAELLLALGHLHSLGIIYRDLKPENILMDAQGHVHIADFGLAKEQILDNSSALTFCGTPEYLAPEILRAEGHGRAVDWWSLGTLLFEMLAGLPPFYDRNVNRMYERILNDPLVFPSRMGTAAQDLISKLLIRDPSLRLGSGEADFVEIQKHPFFRPIKWDALMRKEHRPPFIPAVRSDTDTNNFEVAVTGEPVTGVRDALNLSPLPQPGAPERSSCNSVDWIGLFGESKDELAE